MRHTRVFVLAMSLTAVASGWRSSLAASQDVPPAPPPGIPLVRPVSEGPLHEAFLSPAKDGAPVHIDKAPPAPIVERPGVDPPDPRAQWIDGYWVWDDGRKDFMWATGTWRVPPPGRFWVNGYWKRDDEGWYRVPGFWSDRKTDRIDYRKNGPPADRPAEEPGESPGADHFYVPGQYFPDGDGVVWKPGFWAKAQPGWSWVPAQWIRQPEGWTFQEGYWDRTLDDRGTLFAPAEVAPQGRAGGTVYQPYTQISPQSYGLLYGAFGRPNSYYDGYPGCYFDPTGRYYGYAQYGSLGSYYGYLDYPYYGGFGYPYYATPLGYGYGGYGYGGYGYGGYGYGGLFGFGYPFGFGFGYPFGFGYGFGFPFLGYGFGFPWFGFGGFGGGFHHRFPFNPGGGRNTTIVNGNNNRIININNSRLVNNTNVNQANRGTVGNVLGHHGGVQPPPSSRPFANPFMHTAVGQGRQAGVGTGSTVRHASGVAGSNWNAAFNGGHGATVQHTSARPAFSSTAGHAVGLGSHAGVVNGPGHALGGGVGGLNAGVNHGGLGALGGNLGGQTIHPGGGALGAGAGGLSGAMNRPAMGAGTAHLYTGPNLNAGAGRSVGGLGLGNAGAANVFRGGGLGGGSLGGGGFNAPVHLGGGYGGLGGGGFASPHMGMGGGFSAPHMGGFSAAPHMGGSGGGGGHMGGFGGGGGHMGGFGGGGGHGGGGGGHR